MAGYCSGSIDAAAVLDAALGLEGCGGGGGGANGQPHQQQPQPQPQLQLAWTLPWLLRYLWFLGWDAEATQAPYFRCAS